MLNRYLKGSSGFLLALWFVSGCGGDNTPCVVAFLLASAPSSRTVTQGQSAAFTLTLTAVNGFSNSASLTVSGLPANATGSFAPATVTPTAGGAPSALTVVAAANTPLGTSTLTITATGGGITKQITVQLIVQAANAPIFTIAASPPTRTITQGQSTTYSVTLTSVNGFAGTVNLTVNGLPANATGAFAPASVPLSVNGTGMSTLTIMTAANTPAGTTMPAIVGTSGALTNQTAVTLTVTALAMPRGILVADSIALDGFDDMNGANWQRLTGLISAQSVCGDGAGRVFFTSGYVIHRVDNLTGANEAAYGSTGGGVGQFSNPRGVYVAVDGRIYIADTGNGRIVRIDDMNGTNWVSFSGQPIYPGSVFVDSSNRIYIADDFRHRITRMDDMNGTNLVNLGGLGAGANQFNGPRAIWVAGGQIFVADTGNHRIVRINDMTGASWTTYGTQGAGIGQFGQPFGVAVGSDGRIYVADNNNLRVVRIDDMSGTNWTSYTRPGAFDQLTSIFVR